MPDVRTAPCSRAPRWCIRSAGVRTPIYPTRSVTGDIDFPHGRLSARESWRAVNARTSLERLVSAAALAGANPRPTGANSYRTVGICHSGDRADTLSIRYEPARAFTSVHCFKGCGRDAILWALNLTRPDQYDEPRYGGERPVYTPPAPMPAGRPPVVFDPAPHGWAPPLDAWMPPWCGHRKVAEYLYRDETGRVLYGVARCERKDFAQWRPAPDSRAGRRWKLNEKRGGRLVATVRPVPYMLPQLLAGVQSGRRVYVVEGEKDANALAALGEVATCGKGGCGEGWHADYTRFFQGADVIVVADRDVSGRKHAEAVVDALLPAAASLELVIAAQGKDAADHLAAGGTPATFVSVWTPKPKNLETTR